jgi:ribosomal protein S18 acetylase RimI-like enzyme
VSEALRLCRTLDAEIRKEAAALARAAIPLFYEPLPQDEVLHALANEFMEDGCELSESLAEVRNETVAGLIAAYPSSELRGRQQSSLHHLLSQMRAHEVAPFLIHVKLFSSGVPPVPAGTHYLARLSVIPEQRASGLADRLLSVLLSSCSGGEGLSLHVHSDNRRAIAFYQKHGFSIAGRGDQPYIAMYRTI